MSAPDRIYLDGDAEAGDGYFTRCFETAKPCSEPAIEYVRADLCDPTQDERVKRLVEAAKVLAREMDFMLRQNPRKDGGMYREATNAVQSALRDMGVE